MQRSHMNSIRDIIYRLREHESLSSIHRSTSIGRKTIRKYARLAGKHGLLDPSRPLPDVPTLRELFGPPPSPPLNVSTVDPFRATVERFISQGVHMKAIWHRLQEECGYRGGYSSVCRFVHRLRSREGRGKIRIETPPGEEAQVDFGYAGPLPGNGKNPCRVWVFVMTLCWSRHQFVEFVTDQKIATWNACHEHAFRWFGGVPRRVVLDNLKSAVLSHTLCDPVLGEPYRRLAQHYGFLGKPHGPRCPEMKGKVESGVGYVKGNFLAGRTFADLQAMNDRGRLWVMETAGTRIHGTTQERPLARFRDTEQALLQPLPIQPFDLVKAVYATVQEDCHVHLVDGHYSAPWALIGTRVEVYVGHRLVEIFKDGSLITTHPYAGRGKWGTRLEHYPPEKQDYLILTPAVCQERASKVGPSCATLVASLLGDRVQDRLPGVQSLLRLPPKFGAERVEAACRRAIFFQDLSYRRVKTILQAGLELEPLPEGTPPILTKVTYSFARPMSVFFDDAQEGSPTC